METRDFGKRTGYDVAQVSIGGMRLPGDSMEAVKLLRRAIDSGMKYIDTSRGYGESEYVIGKALKDGYRDKVFLSSKCSPWIKKVQDSDDGSADSVRYRIDETMLRLDVDQLDFYQVWNISSPENWETATKKGGMVDGIKKAMDEGLVKHTGFTSHEKPENLLKYLDEADWAEVLLVSYNMMSRDYAPVLEKAHGLGIGTIVMNPVGGGKLAEASPVLMKLAEELGSVSVPDLAVRYVLSNPNVDTILCGMSKLSDPDDTIASAERGPFTEDQMKRIEEFFEELSGENVHFCTSCGYCQPCPAGITIPNIMSAIHQDRYLGLKKSAKGGYKWSTRDVTPEACKKCGECEEKCTQGIEIMKELEFALAEYGEKAE